MTKEGKVPVDLGPRHAPLDDAPKCPRQRPVARGGVGKASGQRLGVLSMPRKVEGRDHIAVLRQGEREGLHELLRAGKAVGDGDEGRRWRARPGIERHRNAAELHALDPKPRAFGFEPHQRQYNQHQADAGYNGALHGANLARADAPGNWTSKTWIGPDHAERPCPCSPPSRNNKVRPIGENHAQVTIPTRHGKAPRARRPACGRLQPLP